MNIESWETTSKDWVEDRERRWKTEGMPLVVAMYQRGGDLDPKKSEAIKQYFLTGLIDEDNNFPLFYLIRFYPGEDQEWLESCIRSADDFSLARFFAMYPNDSLGKHNEQMAKVLYSSWVTTKLYSLKDARGKSMQGEAVFWRDCYLVEQWRLYVARSINQYRDKPDHYSFNTDDIWLSIAQDFESRSNYGNEVFIEFLEIIMSSVIEKLCGGDDPESKEYRTAIKFKKVLDSGLYEDHILFETWNSKKVNSGVS